MISELTLCTRPDTPEIVRIRREIEGNMAMQGNTQWPLGSLTASQIAAQVDAGEFFALRAPFGDIVAVVRILDTDPSIWGADRNAVYLHTLMTNPAYSGQSMGSKLLRLMDDVARRRGVDYVRLDCVPALLSFYKRHGFVDTGRTHTGNHSPHVHAHLMERRVPAARLTSLEAIVPLTAEFSVRTVPATPYAALESATSFEPNPSSTASGPTLLSDEEPTEF
ncbi:GNAT family N-acetyltransferase [Neoactinobaculum massilliense]|uniref:GNAT family N-acetyltransferase n=1 Tax=Neoactinobaculum massilliense TaxID=2364794 RepID=UPI0013DD98BE|nr:GNAT family N-acetyltransferase [Neoactinobaculum massilliense]